MVCTQSLEILVRYKQSPSIALRNKLVQLNAGLVRKVANRVGELCREPYEDLEQLGYVGLLKAIERFDPSNGNAFSSFAVPYIRGEMLHYLRDRAGTVKIPRRWLELQRAGEKAHDELCRTLGRMPRDSEMAAALGITLDDWREAKLSRRNRKLVSLDVRLNTGSEEITLGESLPSREDCIALQEAEERKAALQQALNRLEAKTRTVIEVVFYEGRSVREAARQTELSPSAVDQILAEGLSRLRGLLGTGVR